MQQVIYFHYIYILKYRCVRNFDHHCIWFNNCIGQTNYKYFFICINSLFIHLACYLVQTIIFTVNHINKYQIIQNLKYLIPIWLICLLIIPFIFLIVNLIGLHIYLIKQGLTTYQFIKQKQAQQRKQKEKNINQTTFTTFPKRNIQINDKTNKNTFYNNQDNQVYQSDIQKYERNSKQQKQWKDQIIQKELSYKKQTSYTNLKPYVINVQKNINDEKQQNYNKQAEQKQIQTKINSKQRKYRPYKTKRNNSLVNQRIDQSTKVQIQNFQEYVLESKINDKQSKDSKQNKTKSHYLKTNQKIPHLDEKSIEKYQKFIRQSVSKQSVQNKQQQNQIQVPVKRRQRFKTYFQQKPNNKVKLFYRDNQLKKSYKKGFFQNYFMENHSMKLILPKNTASSPKKIHKKQNKEKNKKLQEEFFFSQLNSGGILQSQQKQHQNNQKFNQRK